MEENRKERINLEEKLGKFVDAFEEMEDISVEAILKLIGELIDEIDEILVEELDQLDPEGIVMLTKVSVIAKTWARATTTLMEDLGNLGI